MKGKTLISIILILFVVVSVIVLFAKESNKSDKTDVESSIIEDVQNDPAAVNAGNQATDAVEPSESPETKKDADAIPIQSDLQVKLPAGHKIIATYFHGNKRCYSCNTIESLSEFTFHENFAREMADGILTWRTANTDKPENSHFTKDYKLTASSLVLSYTIDGKETRWVNLDKVWALLHTKEIFISYVTIETRKFMRNEE